MPRHVDIEHSEPGHLAGRHADKRAGIAKPQLAERGRIGSSVEEPVWRRWSFIRGTREAFPSLGDNRECAVEGRKNLGLGHAPVS
jgi:hypothetical protein